MLQHWRIWLWRLLVWGAGSCEALLLARLVARLLAARPDNPMIHLLYTVSLPLVQPLAFLDANQPRFGAILELSTFALLISVPVASYLLALLLHPVAHRATSRDRVAS